jgi:hypothetical protein
MTASPQQSLINALHSPGPAHDRADRMGLYAFLIGRWEVDAIMYADDGTKSTGRGEVHAGWVLEGRAIQDVWILPGVFYGTTLRIYDPALDAWRILWSDPATNFFTQQIGRAQGSNIVQTGPDPRGGTMRWIFSEIQPDAFSWAGERAADSVTWRREVDIRARRAS